MNLQDRLTFERWAHKYYGPDFEDECEYDDEDCPVCSGYPAGNCRYCDNWGTRFAYNARRDYEEQKRREGPKIDIGFKDLPLLKDA